MTSGGDAEPGPSSGDEESGRPSLEELAESIEERRRDGRPEVEPPTDDAVLADSEFDSPTASDAVTESEAGSSIDDGVMADSDVDSPTDHDAVAESAGDVPEEPARAADPHAGGADRASMIEGIEFGDPPDADPTPRSDDLGLDPSRTEAVVDVVGGRAGSLLVLGPAGEPTEYHLCSRLVAARSGTENLLLVTNTQPAEEHIALFQGYLERFPERTTVLAVGDPGRSASTATVSVGEERTVTVETINDGTDLMRLGIVISKLTSEWESAGGESVICFNSLSRQVEAVTDAQAVFRFTHILLARLRQSGIQAHFHMDPSGHDADTLDTFRELFDDVVVFDEAGGVDLAD